MTSVIGHLYGLDFRQEYRKWHSCPPGRLFEAPVVETLEPVGNKTTPSKGFAHEYLGQKGYSG